MDLKSVPESDIDALMELATFHHYRVANATVVVMELPNGFTLTEQSACMDAAAYNHSLGIGICQAHLKNQLWAFEAYHRMALRPMEEEPSAASEVASQLTFGDAIRYLQAGYIAYREGWNGRGIFIKLQVPDEHSKMTQPYIYISTVGLETDNDAAPKGVVPWLASQTDMLANDWIVEEEYHNGNN